ncbi:hypothetical protein K439DRAFT_1279458, partial [Ramaria rubella]
IFTYGDKHIGTLTITMGDLDRQEHGQCLNDNMVEFGLKESQYNLRNNSNEQADNIHIFSMFFFSILHMKGYSDVRNWTRRCNIFNKKYIIVPIHEK